MKDTTHDLKLRLQCIDEKLSRKVSVNFTADLKDEKDVTENCLRICHEAKLYIESVQEQEAPLLQGNEPMIAHVKDFFTAQVVTPQALEANRNELVKTIKALQKRLSTVINEGGSQRDHARSQFLEDIKATKQCLEVCNQASEQVNPPHHRTKGCPTWNCL